MACDCPDRTTEIPQSVEDDFLRLQNAECYGKPGDHALNNFLGLKDIASAIRQLADANTPNAIASGLIKFSFDTNPSLTSGQIVNVQNARSCFNYKVVGFGASVITFTPGGGSSSTDDILRIKLWDFTAGAQIGDTIVISSVQLHGKVVNNGETIGNNITPGHIFGIKIEYQNTDSGSFTMPNLDVWIHVEPVELINE